MFYRKNISWPHRDEDNDQILVSFVLESAHGSLYEGHPNDGMVIDVVITNPGLVTKLRELSEAGLLQYPVPQRNAVYAEIYSAAEASSQLPFAGQHLKPLIPVDNLPSMHDVDGNFIREDGLEQDNRSISHETVQQIGNKFAEHMDLRRSAKRALLKRKEG